jgi:alpha-1,6-mannosyltransferase
MNQTLNFDLKRNENNSPLGILLLFTLFLAVVMIAFFIKRTDSILLISTFLVAFGGYGLFFFKKETIQVSVKTGIIIGLSIRFVLIFVLPSLSDDFYRFIWDGRLLNHGINPFLELPSYYINNDLYGDFLTLDIYHQLNSQNYFTVYPPVLQGVFWLATYCFPNSVLGSVIIMKLVLFLLEAGSIYCIIQLLRHFKQPENAVLLYALNPVVMLEIVGNLHFEGIMIFFLLLFLLFFVKNKKHLSAVSIGIAIVAKLLPLMFLPFLIKRLKWKSIVYFLIVGLTIILLFAPLLNQAFLTNISESVGLYFQHFEYNGSVYYILRWLGFQLQGFNMIGFISPILALSVFSLVIYTTFFKDKMTSKELPFYMLFALTAFYLLSTTVHPWYITTMIALSTLTRFRYPVIWSGLIFLTYINYGYEPFRENIWVVTLEYSVLFGFIYWEFVNHKKRPIQ